MIRRDTTQTTTRHHDLTQRAQAPTLRHRLSHHDRRRPRGGGPGRATGQRDARFAYNHIVNPYVLMYLIEAIQMRPELVEAAQMALKANAHSTLMQMSGAVRRVVPWAEVCEALVERMER